ncbi:hypothetical protein [Candidatus Amarolinea dominans]|nr:hypothetical protein [Anaerolineae bacterium]
MPADQPPETAGRRGVTPEQHGVTAGSQGQVEIDRQPGQQGQGQGQ